MPLPPDLKNCDLQSKKDAQSALSRAKTEECKALIRNITCLGQAGRLYDRSLENSCHLGRSDPGKPFQEIPISHGTGPPARVVFLLSVHGRPFRQVKRLLKAIYHTDHYYFIHVDSVSCFEQSWCASLVPMPHPTLSEYQSHSQTTLLGNEANCVPVSFPGLTPCYQSTSLIPRPA